MQPYIFPYIGYFQLIKSVDKFVFYDDVNFIKQGWINRNKILVSGQDFLFTIPLSKANSFCLIKDTKINEKFYENWKLKFLQTLSQNYKKAPFYNDVIDLITSILNKNFSSISDLAICSVKIISKYLGIKTVFAKSSEIYNNQDLKQKDRLFDICKTENIKQYYNPIGGMELYKKEDFLEKGIELNFIKTLPTEYKQFKNEFVPWLSIIDVLMFNNAEEINVMLDNYELI